MSTHPMDFDDRILYAIACLPYLTNRQLGRLFGRDPDHFYRFTNRLIEAGWILERGGGRRHQRGGRDPYYFRLSERGRRRLASLGVAVEGPIKRPSDDRTPSSLHMGHTVVVNDVFVTAQLLASARLTHLMHERAMPRELSRVRTKVGKYRHYPDGWLCFATEAGPVALLLEVDNDTQDEKPFREKIAWHCAFIAEEYHEIFRLGDFMGVATLTTGDAGRRDRLTRWIEAELTARFPDEATRHEYAQAFLVSNKSPVVDAEEFFRRRHWRQPFSDQGFALI